MLHEHGWVMLHYRSKVWVKKRILIFFIQEGYIKLIKGDSKNICTIFYFFNSDLF